MSNSYPIQPNLFQPETLHNVTTIESVDGIEIPVSYGPEGSYISVKDRALLLIDALDSISQRNIRDGFSQAPYREPYDAPIWARYRESTQQVIDGASRNRNMYQEQLRRSFWQATGFSALRGSGLIRERQINPTAQRMWRDFNESYGHPNKLKARNKYKKILHEQIVQVNQSEIAA